MGVEILRTNRLLLKEASLTDTEFIYTLLNSPTWLEHIGDRGINSLKSAEDYIKNSLIRSYENNGFGLFIVLLKSEQTPIGLCGLVKRTTMPHPDIGFAILPQYAGNGYISEAAKATFQYGLTTLKLQTILGITSQDNMYSKSILQKIGLSFKENKNIVGIKNEVLIYSN